MSRVKLQYLRFLEYTGAVMLSTILHRETLSIMHQGKSSAFQSGGLAYRRKNCASSEINCRPADVETVVGCLRFIGGVKKQE